MSRHQPPPVSARVDRGLYDAARKAAGLPPDASQGQVVRYALAALAGMSDPRSVAIVPIGYYPRKSTTPATAGEIQT